MDALLTVFLAGAGSAASPCLLPLYPAFLAFLSGSGSGANARRASAFLGLAVLGGVLSAILVVAIVLAIVAVPFGRVLAYVVPLVDVVLILLGILLLAGRNPFARLPSFRVPLLGHPLASAYLYGLMLGPIAMPCAGPFVVVAFTISLTAADALGRAGTFFVYGLGFGLPLLLLSFAARFRQEQIVRFLARRHRVVELVAGTLLIVAGVADLVTNWPAIRFTFRL